MFFSDGVERIAANAVVMNVYSTQNTDTSKERDLKNATFMYFQVLIDILLGISITTNQNFLAKQDLLDHFKIVYKGNAAQEQIIEEFENNYKPEEAIRWYTRPTFLYSILNKALRNFDYDVLFALRFFINDLQRNLAAAHEAFLTSYELGDPIISVYRGQNISVADLNYLRQSIGQFVAMQSFLSTTSDKKFAKFFAESSAPTTTDTTCIVFEFHLDTRVSNTKPYANIKHLSYFPEEEEVLLMLGSIFRIEQIEYNELEETWIGILNLCSDDDYELKELMEHLKEDAGEGIISPAYLLYRQGDHEKAKQYCQQLLLDPSLDDQDRVNCYRVLSAIANAHDEYDDILENLQKQLELQVLRNNPMETAVTYTFIGETYLFKNDFDQALSYEQKALEILLPLNVPQLANVYAIMANIWMQKKDFSLALTYHEKGLAVDQQYLPENHQTFGITYANIGATYHLSGDLMKALEYYNKAREVYSKTIAPDHPNALYVEENIRRVNRLINKQEHE
jgi:tetratricopeptide (TPR) repeat protein